MTDQKFPHAIITGGSSGIGLALAKILAKDGWSLSLIARSEEKLQRAKEEIQKICNQPSQRCEIYSVDVADLNLVKQTIEQAVHLLGTPDLVVTSAGIAKAHYFDTLDQSDFRSMMEINYFGTLHVIQTVLPFMKAARQGQIVLVSSAAALSGIYGYTAYGPSKFAVRGLGESLRAELKPFNIHVSIAYPPDTDTPQLVEENKTKPEETKRISQMGGVLSADEMALAIKKGIDRREFIITPTWGIFFLARFHSLLQPLMNWYTDRLIAKVRPDRPIENWGLTFASQPEQILYPSSKEELIEIVQQCNEQKKKLRPIGSLYSYTPLVDTNSIWVSFDKYAGIVSIDPDKLEATIKAGTKLEDLERELYDRGYALPNMGDINKQTLGGFISTGCHGTGKNLKGFCANITGLRLITPQEVIECSPDQRPDIFKACQISLGALGLVDLIKVKILPAYNVAITKKRAGFDECVKNLEHNLNQNNCYEFFWFPYTNDVLEKRINIIQEKVNKHNPLKYFNDYFVENFTLWLVCEVSRLFPNFYRKNAHKIMPVFLTNSHTKMSCYGCYATPRLVRHFEVEYAVPYDKAVETLYELKKLLEEHPTHVCFPVEVRYTKEDDMYLSPSFERNSVWIAVHAYVKDEYVDLFKQCEQLFVSKGGRPHWGKLHWRKHAQLKEMYRELDTFTKIRDQLDPNRIFSNAYLNSIIGE